MLSNPDPTVLELQERIHIKNMKNLTLDPDVMPMYANVLLELFDEHGVLKESQELHNLVVTAGKQSILLITSPKAPKDFAWMAIGTGATAAALGDTTLQTESARSAQITPTNPDANTLQFVNTFAAGVGTGALTECGMLSAASVGTLLNRLVFSVINKGALDSLQITMQFT